MRMKTSRVNELKLFNREVSKDSEGVTLTSYTLSSSIKAETWPATSHVQAQTYGERLRSILNMRIEGEYSIQEQDGHYVYDFEDFSLCEGDGIGIYTDDKPDYKIISIKPYKPLRLEIEKL